MKNELKIKNKKKCCKNKTQLRRVLLRTTNNITKMWSKKWLNWLACWRVLRGCVWVRVRVRVVWGQVPCYSGIQVFAKCKKNASGICFGVAIHSLVHRKSTTTRSCRHPQEIKRPQTYTHTRPHNFKEKWLNVRIYAYVMFYVSLCNCKRSKGQFLCYHRR